MNDRGDVETRRPSGPDDGWPREVRLRKRADFVRVQSQPRARFVARSFVLLVSPREEASPREEVSPGEEVSPREGEAPNTPRFGLVASKKVGGAVVRNRSKRLLREALRRRKHLFVGAFDVVLVALPRLADKKLVDVLAELDQLAPAVARRLRAISR